MGVSVFSSVSPSRVTTTRTGSQSRWNSKASNSQSATRRSPICTSTSPLCSPARSAGLPGSTAAIGAPADVIASGSMPSAPVLLHDGASSGAAPQPIVSKTANVKRRRKKKRITRGSVCYRTRVSSPTLARRLGAFDATMLVMGGIIGSGIFINPSVVAQYVHTTPLILGVWAAGGLIALMGAFVYAELAALRPDVGGQYAYLRDAWHPSVAFLYGWSLLLVIQSGGMAAVAVTFARYTVELTGTGMPDWMLATLTLAILTLINCLGVRSGNNTQTALMLLKLAAIGMLIVAGMILVPPATVRSIAVASSTSLPLALAAAMTPVM